MKNGELSLYSWIKNSYFKKLIIPLIIFQIFIFLILVIYNFEYKNMATKHIYNYNVEKINNILNFEINQLNRTLNEIGEITKIYGLETAQALNSKENTKGNISNRLKYNEKGIYYTYKNNDTNDGVAVFYTGFYPVKEKERLKVAKLESTEPIMKNIIKTYSLVSSIYFNSFDSLNIIYPYFDVISQYGNMADVTKYNFYYDADIIHNPNKTNIWTNAYLDPAGHEWMISSIYPVYNKNFLEGVVGLDVTLETVIKKIINTKVPWSGYMTVVDNTGTIMAIPEKGEEDFSIKELKRHFYNEAIKKDTFKPEDFNIYENTRFSDLKKLLQGKNRGNGEITINGNIKMVNWETIDSTSWKLLVFSDKKELLDDVNNVSFSFYKMGISLLLLFGGLQILVFLFLNQRIKKISSLISTALLQIDEAIINIGNEVFSTQIKKSNITEINKTFHEISELSIKLDNNIKERKKAQKKLFEYQSSLENIIEERTENLTKINRELKELQSQIIQKEKLVSIGQLAAGVSHEINNPIGFIQSNLSSLDLYYNEYLKYISYLESKISKESIDDMNEYKKINQFEYVLEDTKDIFLESQEGIKRIIETVKNLKDFSSLDEESKTEEFDINKNILITLNILKIEYENIADISLELNATNEVHFSNSEINQVILNLLRNSIYSVKIKHIDSRGIIKIITNNTDSGIEFIIWDNGIGIEEKDKSSIFNPFFTTKPQGVGSGFGLYVAYDVVVNKYGGTISFESNSDNTQFRITLHS